MNIGINISLEHGAVKILLVVSSLLILLLPSVHFAFAQAVSYRPPHDKPGPALDKVTFRAFAQEIVPPALEKGDMDLYIFPLRITTAREMTGKQGVELLKAPANTLSILVNPAPAPRGQLNPFSIKEVRRALQNLINREFIANEIYGGLAVSMVGHVSRYDYDYLTVRDTVQKFNAQYDPEQARRTISDAMQKAGANLSGGKWIFQGQPIRLKFVIRIEDERREIGDLISAELEKAGFTVDPLYQQFGPAIQKVYVTDPKLFEWHLYTEGWGKGSAEKYDYANINQMYAPWLGNMPGWLETGYWQYENVEADRIGKKIFTGGFKDANERDQLYKQLTSIGMDESVRLWVATVLSSFPVKSGVQGMTTDLATGPKSIWTLREAFIPGKTELTVGNLWVWTERTIWNPVGGFGDIYSVDIWKNLYDPPTFRHPFTGVPIPFRATYSVVTSGPNGKMPVPSDAFLWDSASKSWSSVSAGTQATSKVVFNYGKYLNSKWHNGQPITMADILYNIYQSFDMVYNPDKAKIEFATATVAKPYRDTFRGFRIVNDTSIEVYVDYWHFERDYIADYAQPVGLSMPWPILAAMDTLVFEKRQAAYSDTAAAKFGVPWISLVEENHARLVRDTLNDFTSKRFFPENVFTLAGNRYARVDDAVNGYRAAVDWFSKTKTMIVSNGPFALSRFDPASQSAEIQAFRDPSYPFKPGQWYYGSPSLVEITGVRGGPLAIGSATSFTVQVTGPGSIGVRFSLIDQAQSLEVFSGTAQRTAQDSFTVQIPADATSRLKAGQYQLVLTAFSDQLSYVSERTQAVAATVSPPATTTTTTTQPSTQTQPTTTTTVTTTPTRTTTTETRSQTQPQTALGGQETMLIGAAGAIILIIVVIVVWRLKAKPSQKPSATTVQS
ncbi:MAG: hypothetical protein HYU39_05380 [Thaumarchaeota archaeon]|nr:hypothetical protein [Nitrososphaerota archaeon]